MTPEELNEWADDFVEFHGRFHHLFGRSEGRTQVGKYLRGLLTTIERKNSWQLAEAVGDTIPDATQRLLYQTEWDADAARDLLQGYVVEHIGDDEGIGVVDETGFIKKGRHSAGVKRQYSGTAGKVENCQVGVFLTYASRHGHAFLDRRLYLPEEWCADQERRERAKIPDTVQFQTKPELAMNMLMHAWKQGVPMQWVTGDELYGDSTAFRESVAANGRWYVVAVRSNMAVWVTRPAVVLPGYAGQGRRSTRLQLAPDAPRATIVNAVVAAWPESRWQRLTVHEGAKGPVAYDWACQRIIESCEQLPGRDGWLVARRSVSHPNEIAYYLSNAPVDIPLSTLVRVASTRYTVEQCFEEAKGDTGLDHYEVRHWHSWYRHITLSMMAHAWLAAIRRKAVAEKGGAYPSSLH